MRPARIVTAAAALAALAATAPGAIAQTPPAPSVILQYQFRIPGATTKLTKLQLKNVPAGSAIVVRCLTADGDRCGGKLRRNFSREDAAGTVRVRRFEGKRLKPGMKLDATITNPSYLTQYKTLTIRRRDNPTITTTCSQPGSDERGAC